MTTITLGGKFTPPAAVASDAVRRRELLAEIVKRGEDAKARLAEELASVAPVAPVAPLPPPCVAVQYSDSMVCVACGLAWDTNDSARPPCKAPELRTKRVFPTPAAVAPEVVAPLPPVEAKEAPPVVATPIADAVKELGSFDAPDEEEVRPSFISRAFSVLGEVTNGVKVLLSLGVVSLGGLADQFDLVDIVSTVKGWVGESAKAGGIIAAVCAVYFGVKLYSKFFGGGAGKLARGMDEGE